MHLTDETPPISDLALESLARQYITILAIFDRLSQNYPPEVLHELVDMPVVDEALLGSETAMGEWGALLVERLNQKSEASVSYTDVS